MIHLDDILFVIQARLTSQRIPQKMIRPFANTTLVDIALEKIHQSIIPLNNFYFSVFDERLIEIGNKWGVNIYHRSETSARSEGWPLTDIYEWYSMPYKWVILISACNPLLRVETINAFIQRFVKLKNYHHGLFGVIKKHTYFWDSIGNCITPFTDGERIMNTKKVYPTYEAAHCLYGSRMDLIPEGRFMGYFQKDSPFLFEMNELEAFDIDYEYQFKLGERLYELRDLFYAEDSVS